VEAAWLWKIYFWLAVVVFGGSAVARTFLYVAKPGLVSLYEVAISLCSIPVLFAIWGYIYNEPFLRPWVWQALFIFAAIENVRFFFTPKFRETAAKLGRTRSYAVFGGLSLFSVPMFIAHGIYAFGRQGLWG
jgi:hypothetical protein